MKIEKPDTAVESALLKALAFRKNYEQYAKDVDLRRVLPTTAVLIKDFGHYYTLFPTHSVVNWGIFYTQFGQNWHVDDMTQQDIEYYRDYVLPAIEPKDEDAGEIEKSLLGLLDKQTSESIKELLNTKLDISKLQDAVDTYKENVMAIIPDSIDDRIKTMFDMDFSVLDKSEGIPWFLPSLQKSLLSITRGQLIVISGDTGSGKSAFIASQAAYTLQHQMKKKDLRPLLLLNSEGTLEDAMVRVLSNLLKGHLRGGFEEIVDKVPEVLARCKKGFGEFSGLLKMMQLSDVKGLRTIVKYLKKLKPSILFIDITDTLAPDEDPQSLKKLYDGLRLLSAEYCPIIATTQAGNQEYYDKETNEHKKRKWLTDKALYGSKQKGSASDTMIMIGMSEEAPDLRYVSVTKKKRGTPVNIVCELESIYSNFKEIQY